jgi:hypothetical protein
LLFSALTTSSPLPLRIQKRHVVIRPGGKMFTSHEVPTFFNKNEADGKDSPEDDSRRLHEFATVSFPLDSTTHIFYQNIFPFSEILE